MDVDEERVMTVGAIPTMADEGLSDNDDDMASAIAFATVAGNPAADWSKIDAFRNPPPDHGAPRPPVQHSPPKAESVHLASDATHSEHTAHTAHTRSASPEPDIAAIKAEVRDEIFDPLVEKERRDAYIKNILELCEESKREPPTNMEDMTLHELEIHNDHLERTAESARAIDGKIKLMKTGFGVAEVVMNKFTRKFTGDMSGFARAMLRNEPKIRRDVTRMHRLYVGDVEQTPELSLARQFRDNFLSFMGEQKLNPLMRKLGFDVIGSENDDKTMDRPPPVAIPDDSDDDSEDESDDDDSGDALSSRSIPASVRSRVSTHSSRPTPSSELEAKVEALMEDQRRDREMLHEVVRSNNKALDKIDGLIGAIGSLAQEFRASRGAVSAAEPAPALQAAKTQPTPQPKSPEFAESPGSVDTVGSGFSAMLPA